MDKRMQRKLFRLALVSLFVCSSILGSSPAIAGSEDAGIKSEMERIAKNPNDYWAVSRLGWCYWRDAYYNKKPQQYGYARYWWTYLVMHFSKSSDKGARDCAKGGEEALRSLDELAQKEGFKIPVVQPPSLRSFYSTPSTSASGWTPKVYERSSSSGSSSSAKKQNKSK